MSLRWRETKFDPKSGLPFKQSECGLYTIAVYPGEFGKDQEVMSVAYCQSNGDGRTLLIERFPKGANIQKKAAADRCRAAAETHALAVTLLATA